MKLPAVLEQSNRELAEFVGRQRELDSLKSIVSAERTRTRCRLLVGVKDPPTVGMHVSGHK